MSKKKPSGLPTLPKLSDTLPKLPKLPTLVPPSLLEPTKEEKEAYARKIWNSINEETVFHYVALGERISKGLEIKNYQEADGSIWIRAAFDDERNICFIEKR